MARTRKPLFGPLFALCVVLVLVAQALAVPAFASPPAQLTAPAGAVIQLQGTPHLWIADEQGILHWGGDTRGLAGKFINWSDRRTVTVEQLRSYRLGDPWLSAGLLKMGDPIYQVKWETEWTQPKLLHIQSIADVELFGINATNYGRFVMDRAAWEAQFRFNVDTLERQTLAAAVGSSATATPTTAPAGPTATPVTLRAREVGVNRIETNSYETIIEVTGATPGRRLTVKLDYEEWVCNPSCDTTNKGTWGPIDAGPADSTGKLTYRDTHGAYKTYTYTFTDVNGSTATVTFKDDLTR